MKVYKKLSLEIPGTNTHYFNLDEYSEETSESALYYGYTFLENGTDKNLLNLHNRNVYLNVTMPTEFCESTSIHRDDVFNEVYGICPYSVFWLNEIKSSTRYKTIFYPFNKNDVPNPQQKKYDVIYHGGIHGNSYLDILKNMSKFNYRYLTQTTGINSSTQECLKYATNVDLSNTEKLKVIAESKISICLNTFTVRNWSDANNIKSKQYWWNNEAFKHIDDLKIVPQFKSRCNEAAFCRTLNLVQRDPWNLIEMYYAEDEFVYFDSMDELEYKINDILNNWDKYTPMIEKAYIRSLNYTSENLYKIIKNGESPYEM